MDNKLINKTRELNLLIISHTPHVLYKDKYFGWAPTVDETNFLSSFFKSVKHVAPVKNSLPNSSFKEVNGVNIIPTKNPAGKYFWNKLLLLVWSFDYILKLLINIGKADLIHVRCPANISLISSIVLIFFPRKKKWVKYAGNWSGNERDYFSNRLQRYVITHLLRNAMISINSINIEKRPNVVSLRNPSFLKEELEETISSNHLKTFNPNKKITILFVGRTEYEKGLDITLRAFALFREKCSSELLIIGDGKGKAEFENLSKELGVSSSVKFLGWKARDEIKRHYQKAHFLLLPSKAEGWPKVISEGMAHGVVPIASAISCIPEYFTHFNLGKAIQSNSPQKFADALMWYVENPKKWQTESNSAVEHSKLFTYESWYDSLLLNLEQNNLI